MIDPKPPRVFLPYTRPDRARVAKLAEALKGDVPDGSFRAQRHIPRTTGMGREAVIELMVFGASIYATAAR